MIPNGLNEILQQIVNFAGTFSPGLVLFLFVLCFLGEFGPVTVIPYALDTIWLVSGYGLIKGIISPLELLVLWLAAQAGRQTGALTLSLVIRLGKNPLSKLFTRYTKTDLYEKLAHNNSLPFRLVRKMDLTSPFSIALGRIFWLRFPLTLIMGLRRNYSILSQAVLISGLVWDGVYLTLGMAGSQMIETPVKMLVYSLIGLTVLYIFIFLVRYLWRLAHQEHTS